MRFFLFISKLHTYPSPCSFAYFFLFFFNDTATTEIYTLSLHDALPIWSGFATVPQCRKFNAFIASPKDTNVFVAAVTDSGGGRRLIKSDDHGQSWLSTQIGRAHV